LPALDPSDFQMIAGHSKARYLIGLSELFDVFQAAIHHHPGDPRRGCSACHLRQSRPANWLEHYAIGPSLGIRLYDVEYLLTLLNAIAVSKHDLDIKSQFAGDLFSRNRLFHLVIVILGDE